ncbi:leucine-rich repeat protein [Skeletonema marinoi]|uniref:Leucine-rich repeat protein n=1 Tax=Skeletonema marinoi TaxID=267567 RepID=A0AAD9DHT1_9STRA|nr:leucine-rich repeat protein [Skeletonema marinoi]
MLNVFLHGCGQSTKLESLDVSKTKFNSFDGVNLYFTQLKEVYAARCGLTGSFPPALLDISRLERLDLSFNQMMGELPADIGIFFSKMQVLFLHDNQFSGMLPDSLDNMTELKYVQLDSNKFSGRVPSFYNARGILGIDIRNQKAMGGGLTGSIPSNFLQSADGTIIQYINLSSNHISGELPASLARIPAATMDFSDNEIEAVHPDLCGTDCALILCAPTTYSASGRQPSPMENCSPCPNAIHWGATSCSTVPVSLPSNTIGIVTDDVNEDEDDDEEDDDEDNYDGVVNNNPVAYTRNDLGILKTLYEECGGDQWKNNQNWSGDDFCSFWGITCVPTSSETLVLDGNDIEMDFTSIGSALSLETLSLAFTAISNVDGINQAPSLRKLDIANNKFGSIPLQIFQISTLHELYLGPNSFNLSPIPDSIGDLTELRLLEYTDTTSALKNLVSLNLEEALQELSFLNLAGNYFDGELPSFRASTKLRRVDLSNNAFIGAIPSDFMESVNSDFFEYLDLKGNDLVGIAPGILSRLQKFDISDNFITGLDSDLCNDSVVAIAQDSELNPCVACSGAAYFGQTMCSDEIHSWDEEKDATETSFQPQVASSMEDEMDALIDFYESCAGTYWPVQLSLKEHTGQTMKVGRPEITAFANGTASSAIQRQAPGFDFNLLEKSQSLKELNLDATGISSIEGIHHSPSLEAISLRFNKLQQITELSMVSTLKSIRVSHNQLFTLPSFDNLQNLQTIIADNNNIVVALMGFPSLLISTTWIYQITQYRRAVPSSASLHIDLAENQIDSLPVELATKVNGTMEM